MFKSLFNRQPQRPTYDPVFGNTQAQTLIDLLSKRETDPIYRYLDDLRTEEWDQRNWLIWRLVEHAAPRMIRNAPDSPLGNLIKGIGALHLAWEARSTGQDAQLQQLYGERLLSAVAHFKDAGEADEDDPTPYANLIPAAMALQADQTELHDIFHAATNRDAYNQQAHAMMLQALTKKWGGKHTDMFSFANPLIDAAPSGSTLPLLWMQACLEQWFYFTQFDKDPAAAAQFLKNEEATTKAIQVWDHYIAQQPSVASFEYDAINVAAWWFWQTQDQHRCQQALGLVGDHFTHFPWAHNTPDPVDALFAARTFAKTA